MEFTKISQSPRPATKKEKKSHTGVPLATSEAICSEADLTCSENTGTPTETWQDVPSGGLLGDY